MFLYILKFSQKQFLAVSLDPTVRCGRRGLWYEKEVQMLYMGTPEDVNELRSSVIELNVVVLSPPP